MDYKEEARFIGSRIKEIRTSKRITAEHINDQTGIEPANLRRLERGGTNATIRTLCKIAEALDVKLSDLVR